MCSQYWNLYTNIICPKCERKSKWNLQTHFMGDFGSCVNHYKLGEKVDELKGVDVLLDGRIDDFIGDCPKCGNYFDFGANIVKGKAERVFILNNK